MEQIYRDGRAIFAQMLISKSVVVQIACVLLGCMVLISVNAQSRGDQASDIRKLDFQNFHFAAGGETIRVIRGQGTYRSRGEMNFVYSIDRVTVSYGDL